MSNLRGITYALAIAGVFLIGSPAGAQAPAQIFACVNSANGSVRIVAQNTTCRRRKHLVVWNVVGPQGMAGPAGPVGPAGAQGPQGSGLVQGVNEFICASSSNTMNVNDPYLFIGPTRSIGASVGPHPGPNGGVDGFLLQPGLYQIHLSGFDLTGLQFKRQFMIPVLNPNDDMPQAWIASPSGIDDPNIGNGTPLLNIAGGDRLLQVVHPNTTLQIQNGGLGTVTTEMLNCNLIITQF